MRQSRVRPHHISDFRPEHFNRFEENDSFDRSFKRMTALATASIVAGIVISVAFLVAIVVVIFRVT